MVEPFDSLARVLAVLALVALNGFFVATEFALVSVRRTRVEEMSADGVAGAARVGRALGNLDRFIAGTQLGITVTSLGLGWLGEPALAHLLHEPLRWLPASIEADVIAGTIAFMLITALHIVFGELAPKSLALQRPEQTSLFVVPPMSLFLILFRPAIALLNGAGNAVVRLFGLEPTNNHDGSVHSPEELELLVEQSARGGALEDQERRMLRGVFDVGDRTVRQAMTPIDRVQGLPLTAGLEDAVRRALAARHSRLPVFEGDVNHILGVVHLRDLLRALAAPTTGAPRFSLRHLMRPVLAVPEMTMLDDLLSNLRAQRSHLAVVVDEYGGTAGIITLEDIMEQIVGDIHDEFEPVEPDDIVSYPDGSWMIDGLLALDDLDQQLGTRLGDATDDEGVPLGVTTLGGLIMTRLGRVPALDDVVTEGGPDGPLQLVVREVEGRRAARIQMSKVTPTNSDHA